MAFPDSCSEPKAYSYGQQSQLQGWKLPKARAQNRAHRICPDHPINQSSPPTRPLGPRIEAQMYIGR